MTSLRPPRTLSLVVVALLALCGRAYGEEATRLRILLVVDTQGANASVNGFAFDHQNMKKVFKEALREQHLEHRYTLDILKDKDATPAKILAYYEGLKVEPTETLLCYYSGHGGVDP